MPAPEYRPMWLPWEVTGVQWRFGSEWDWTIGLEWGPKGFSITVHLYFQNRKKYERDGFDTLEQAKAWVEKQPDPRLVSREAWLANVVELYVPKTSWAHILELDD